jgi:hypothetical protein
MAEPAAAGAEVAAGVEVDADAERVESTVAPEANATEKEVIDTAPAPEVPEEKPGELGWQLEFPADLPHEMQDEGSTEVLKDFGAVAAGVGMPADVAQDCVEAVTDAISALGVNNKYDLDDPDAAEATLRGAWGDNYDASLKIVRQNVKALGPKFADWLDESGVGNWPPAIMVLANLGIMKTTPAAAAKKIEALMASPEYTNPDKKVRSTTIAQIAILSRIAGRGEASPEQRLNAAARSRSAPLPGSGFQTRGPDTRAQIAKILADSNHPLNISGHRNHAEAVAEFQKLLARL